MSLLGGSLIVACIFAADSTSGVKLAVVPTEVRLGTLRSRHGLLVTSRTENGYANDVTRQAKFSSANPKVATVDEHGVLRPRGKGRVQVTARWRGLSVRTLVIVGDLTKHKPVSFRNEVMPIIGKSGCNSGNCHGHNSGKGDFKLSLRGYNLSVDHRTLLDKDSGRVDLETPDNSLILSMPTSSKDHGGGKRFEQGSDFHRTLKQWISEGAKSDVTQGVQIKRLEVHPKERVFTSKRQVQQLMVRAHFADGQVRDVTHLAVYELSQEGVVDVSATGQVRVKRTGEAAVFVRCLGKMGISRITVIRHRSDFKWKQPPVHNFVDRYVFDKLRRIQVLASNLSSDTEFLRRVYLDTVANVPSPAEVREFLADKRSDKRARKIDELLRREGFGDQWAAYWLELSGTTETGDSARFKGAWTLSLWLRGAFHRNLPYDRFVREVVASKGSSIHRPAMTFTTNQLARNEVFAQLFLGIRIQCAKCHDHPFDVWTQSDYRAQEKFFQGLGYKEGSLGSYGREIRRFVKPERFLPWEKNKLVSLRLLDGTVVKVKSTKDRREVLVDWLFGAAKVRTSRALVNRVWGRLLGRGIVHPVDDMRFSNPAVNEPLLEALARDFIKHGYDFKHLVRTILNSRTYQLSSIPNESNRRDHQNFSHARLRRLSAEHLLDVIAKVTGVDEKFRIGPPGMKAVNLPFINIQSRFLETFGRPNDRTSSCECVRSPEPTLPQILHLLNGATISQRLKSKSGTLGKLLATNPKNQRLIESLYVTVLGRPATTEQFRVADLYLKRSPDRRRAARDLMWSLITSQEFLFNH